MAFRIKLMPIVVIILIAAAIGIIWQAMILINHTQYNQAFTSKKLSNNSNADYMMLNAWKLTNQKDYQKAVQLYTKVARGSARYLHASAHYNAGNGYQKLALQLLEEKGLGAWDEVTPLLSMAKEHYRSALRFSPNWLEAKYNFELALRFSPNIESATQKIEKEEEPEEGEAVNGWPSIPGFPRGMP